MAKRIVIIAIFMILLIQCGCGPDYVVLRGHYEPFGILENDMPYADKLNTRQFDHVKRIETDSYGRAHYIYSTYSTMWSQEIYIHVISQKSDRKNVYYYEDLSYLMESPDGEALGTEEIEAFKGKNDWDSPLDNNKMISATKDTSQTEIEDLEVVERAVINHLGLPNDTVAVSNGIEAYTDFGQIFVVQIDCDGDGFTDRDCCYITLYSLEESGKIIHIDDFPQTSNCNEYVSAFKKSLSNISETKTE